jgi:hypothetical protein
MVFWHTPSTSPKSVETRTQGSATAFPAHAPDCSVVGAQSRVPVEVLLDATDVARADRVVDAGVWVPADLGEVSPHAAAARAIAARALRLHVVMKLAIILLPSVQGHRAGGIAGTHLGRATRTNVPGEAIADAGVAMDDATL